MAKVLLVAFFIFPLLLFAQDDNCVQTLQSAQEEFIAGRFYGIPALLKPCLDRGFTKEQRKDAYLLLTRAYLYADDPIGAENAYLKLLELDPEYRAVSPRDAIDVVYLSQKFTTRPIFTLHTKAGINSTFERVIAPVSISGFAETPIETKTGIGFNLGGGVDYNFADFLSLGVELNAVQRNFRRSTFLVNDEINVSANQFLIEAPVYLKYQGYQGRIRPFGYAGVSFSFLLADGLTVELSHSLAQPGQTETDLSAVITNSSSRINVMPSRNLLNRSVIIGGGAIFKIGADFIKAELSYLAGLTNYVNPLKQIEYAINNPNSGYNRLLEFGYFDNYFSVNNLSISFGYIKPLYNPRYRKSPSNKAIIRKLNKDNIRKGGEEL